jgi:hypothetical protein
MDRPAVGEQEGQVGRQGEVEGRQDQLRKLWQRGVG